MYKWKYNIKTDLKILGFPGAPSIHLIQYMDQWWNLCAHDNEVLGSIKGAGFHYRQREEFLA
jgi:hypothetical protein